MTCGRLSLLILVVAAVTGSSRWASAIIQSDRGQDQVITPGQLMYGMNLGGVAALGSGTPSSAPLADIDEFPCSGAFISDQHLLTAAHCLDTDEDGNVDFFTRSLPYVAGVRPHLACVCSCFPPACGLTISLLWLKTVTFTHLAGGSARPASFPT